MARLSKFPPRGSGVIGQEEVPPRVSWASPDSLSEAWNWKPGRVKFGQSGGRVFGLDDNRHIIVVAGSRAGKTRKMLVPNIVSYPGPCVIIDPKGELVALTKRARESVGKVHVLDPFGITGQQSSNYNPFKELAGSNPENQSANASQIADALIVEPEGARDSHWTDSAKNLIKGLILYLLDKYGSEATLVDLRRLLTEHAIQLHRIFKDMSESDAYDGAMANIGAAFFAMVEYKDGAPVGFTNEMRSIISTAYQQTGPLDDVTKVMQGSDFSLTDIGPQNLTIYLVLPASRISTHYRWLRLFLMQAMAAMESTPIPRGKLPAWFVLEEFAALGHVQTIETASGYMAGFGVRLWIILQDLTQLQRHYKQSWETFLGNAGVVLAFGNIDATTTEYLSKLIGVTEYEHADIRPVNSFTTRRVDQPMVKKVGPLIEPHEVRHFFGIDTGRVLVLAGEHSPLALMRFDDPGGK